MNKYLCALSVALACVAFEAAAQTAGSGQDRTPPSNPPSPTQDPTPPNTPPPRPTETPRPPPNPASGAPRADFGQIDSNGDGSLSADEFNKAKMQGVQLAQLDRNKDGRISREEWSQYDSTQPSQRR